jgi:hypothetical protein
MFQQLFVTVERLWKLLLNLLGDFRNTQRAVDAL